MTKSRPRTCTRCGLTPRDRTKVSYNGLCAPCGEEAEAENARQIAAGEGEYYERWQAGIRRRFALND